MGLPFSACVVRREPVRNAIRVPSANVRVVEQFVPDEAPDPVRQSNFNSFGKPAEHAKSMIQVFATNGRAAYRAVMRDDFLRGSFYAPDLHSGFIRGEQQPYPSRVNTDRGSPFAYGSIVLLQAQGT